MGPLATVYMPPGERERAPQWPPSGQALAQTLRQTSFGTPALDILVQTLLMILQIPSLLLLLLLLAFIN